MPSTKSLLSSIVPTPFQVQVRERLALVVIVDEPPLATIVCGLADGFGDERNGAGGARIHLNEHGYIVPGLGDAGDRIFGTK